MGPYLIKIVKYSCRYGFSEHLGLPPICIGVRVTRSLVLCVCFVDR